MSVLSGRLDALGLEVLATDLLRSPQIEPGWHVLQDWAGYKEFLGIGWFGHFVKILRDIEEYLLIEHTAAKFG